MPTLRMLVQPAVLACAVWTVAADASAAPPPAAGAPGRPAKAATGGTAKRARVDPAIEQAQKQMNSGDRTQIESGIQNLGMLGKREVIAPLADRIRRGLPPELLETAILTLMTLGDDEAGPVLHELALHRRPEVRLRAVEALAALKAPGAETALVHALSDGDDRVRSAAATGLGDLGAQDSLEVLFLALDRGNLAASPAIGKVIDPTQTARLVGYLGKIPFYSLAPALGEVLKRPDVAEPAKLAVITGLQEAATPGVKGFLSDVMTAGGDAIGPNLKRAILRAMQEIAD